MKDENDNHNIAGYLIHPSVPLYQVTTEKQVDDLYALWFFCRFSNSIFKIKVTGYDSFDKEILCQKITKFFGRWCDSLNFFGLRKWVVNFVPTHFFYGLLWFFMRCWYHAVTVAVVAQESRCSLTLKVSFWAYLKMKAPSSAQRSASEGHSPWKTTAKQSPARQRHTSNQNTQLT